MPLGSAQLGDESFVLAGTTYHFRFPERGGALGLGSSSPFAPKSTSGERGYQDYDPFSAVALSDLSGGMGQERLVDLTRYQTAVDTDARGGRIILGPLQTAVDGIGPNISVSTARTFPSLSVPLISDCSWYTAYVVPGQPVDDPRKIAQFLSVATETAIDRIWVPLRLEAFYSGDSIYLTIVTSANDSPTGAMVGSASVAVSNISTVGAWTEFIFPTTVTLSPGDYWIKLEASGIFSYFSWLGQELLVGNSNVSYYNSQATWQASTEYVDMMYWYEKIATYPDRPPMFFTGAGGDNTKRTWLWAGHYLYYTSGASVVVARTGSAIKRMSADITSAVFFSGSADGNTAHIYVAQGSGYGMEKYDANVAGGDAGNVWETIAGAPKALLLAVHDNKLWRSLNVNEVSASLDGANWAADAVEVGDKSYQIHNMLSWNGDLWIGKHDGLYKIVSDSLSAWPTTGEAPTCVRVLNLSTQLSENNFKLMVEYQNDLWFSVGTGLMKLTTGNVLTSVAPEIGLGYNQSSRVSYTAAFSALNTLWVAAEANIDGNAPDTTDISSYSYVLAYFEGKWHPVAALERPGDMIRSIIIDGGTRDAIPTLWYGSGLGLTMTNMPTVTQKRWLWTGVRYADRSILYTSWLDGNIRTIEKDWVQVEIDCLNLTTDDYVKIWWRATENALWELVGTVTTDGLSTLAFPASSHSVKCQLGIELKRGDTNTHTPQVLAIVIKYLERPRDARNFTRTYELATNARWRTGAPVQLSLAEQVAQLETLRESAEPLTWNSWWGGAYQVHIVNYAGSEARERLTDLQDAGTITVTVQLLEVA